jgi:Zn-finger nucleic acid-binding protein
MADYRRGVLRCPACATLLEEQVLGSAQIVVCPACFGIWVDWMDGDLRNVSHEVGTLPRSSVALDEVGGGVCPICRAPLIEMPCGEDGPPVLRCGSCAGAFVPRGSLERVAGVNEQEEGRPSDPLLTRMLDALTRFILG